MVVELKKQKKVKKVSKVSKENKTALVPKVENNEKVSWKLNIID